MTEDAGDQVRVLLADDHALMRHGVRALLEAAGGFDVAGEAADGYQVVPLALRLRPDVLILDLDLPGPSAPATIRRLSGSAGTAKSPVATSSDIAPASGRSVRVLPLGTRAHIPLLGECLAGGAAGFLLKEAPGSELIRAIHEVSRGGRYVSPLVLQHAKGVQPKRGGRRATAPRRATLTAREYEILECVAHGMANREIARQLCLSVRTVEAHKARIVAKLDLRSARDLVRAALQPSPAHLQHRDGDAVAGLDRPVRAAQLAWGVGA
jgi:DNA-binding NarL/FixJ family response regulator